MRQMLIVALIIVGGYFLTRLPIFQIQNIELTGQSNSVLTKELEELKGQSLLSAAASNKVREITLANISILDLHCDKGIPNTLRCAVAFRQPKFVWQTSSGSYLVDSEGYAYAKANTDTDLVTISDRKGLKVEVGDQLMSEEVVAIFESIDENLDKRGIKVDSYFVNTSVLHPGVTASKRSGSKNFPKQKTDIYFSASYPIATQVEILDKLLSKSSNSIKQYIDLRTAGYIYYK
jgi:hypothetical protein